MQIWSIRKLNFKVDKRDGAPNIQQDTNSSYIYIANVEKEVVIVLDGNTPHKKINELLVELDWIPSEEKRTQFIKKLKIDWKRKDFCLKETTSVCGYRCSTY